MEKDLTNLTKEEKARMIAQIEKENQAKCNRGQTIVVTIAVINIISSIINCIFNFDIFALVIQIALTICLLAGVSWVRYLFAVGAVLSVAIALYTFFNVGFMLSPISIVILILTAVYSLVSAILLFKSECVSEFLYYQKNG